MLGLWSQDSHDTAKWTKMRVFDTKKGRRSAPLGKLLCQRHGNTNHHTAKHSTADQTDQRFHSEGHTN